MATYRLIVTGKVLQGQDEAQVRENIRSLFKLQDKPETLEELFRGQDIEVKHGLEASIADRYLQAIKQAGMGCRLEEERSEPSPDQTVVLSKSPAADQSPESQASSSPSLSKASDTSQTNASSEHFNPYQQPQADLEASYQDESGELLQQPNKLSIGAGWDWVTEGFQLFRQHLWVLIGMGFLLFVCMAVLSMIPLVSLAVTVIAPVFTASFMLAFQKLENNQSFGIGQLFAGFEKNVGSLLGAGALYLVGTMVMMVPMFIFIFLFAGGLAAGMSLESADAQMAAGAAPLMVLLGVLIGLLFMMPLVMAYWFAPALIVLHDVPVIQAYKMSFKGCWGNMLPFLWYGLIMLVFSIIAMIPLMLGLLVLGPLVMASMYVSYRQIFIR